MIRHTKSTLISMMPRGVGEKIKNMLETDNSNIFAEPQKQMVKYAFAAVKWDLQDAPVTATVNEWIVTG
jgi:hypothetical protein